MNLWKILFVVGFALVVALVVMMLPSGPKEIAVSYTLKEMDDFRREQFQREALAFHAEVAEPIAARVIGLSRPYVVSFSRPSESFSSIVNDVVLREMPKWAHDELLRCGETEESITDEKGSALLREIPGWEEIAKLHFLLMGSEQLLEAVGSGMVLSHAEAWLAELRDTAIRLRVFEENKVVSR